MILAIRTDKPEAEVALWDEGKQITTQKWLAHRQLAETLHSKIKKQLDDTNKTWSDISGVVCYAGPGSFTGLRIGASVANALAVNLHIPIVAARGNDWEKLGQKRLFAGEDDKIILPHYGSPVHTTLSP